MPIVPTYESFQVAPTTNPNVQVAAPEYKDFTSAQYSQQAEALQKSSTASTRIAADMLFRANGMRVDEATNDLSETAMALRVAKPTTDENGKPVEQGFEHIKGKDALERQSGMPLAEEYRNKLYSRAADIEKGLANEQQRLAFRRNAMVLAQQVYSAASTHEARQYELHYDSVQEGTINNASNEIVVDPTNEELVETNLKKIEIATRKLSANKSRSVEEQDADVRKVISATHLSAIKRMTSADSSETPEQAQLNADAAIQYYKKHQKQMSGDSRKEADDIIAAAGSYLTGVRATDEIWGKFGPKGLNAPINLNAMEKAAREMFPDSPNKQKATIAEIRSRAGSFNATQSEFKASNMDSVGKLLLNGVSEEQIKMNPSFRALGGVEQNQIIEHLHARNSADRQRLESDLNYRSAGTFFEYSDPTKLAGMTRAEVQNLLPTLGMQHTGTLLNKWDSLQNKDYLLQAKMDKQQFDTLADQFGYKPYEKDKSEDDKRQLGMVHQSVNEALTVAAKQKGRPLSDDEKAQVMREQMARQVKMKGWFALEHGEGYWSSSKPAFTVGQSEYKDVYVPQSAREKILAEMKTRYAKGQDKMFAPTEDNVVFWYLQSVKKGEK